MNKKYKESFIKNIMERYRSGESVTFLTAQYGIPRSTLYSWIKQYAQLKSSEGTEITQQDYRNLKRTVAKLEERLKVIKAAECSLSAPLQEKLTALEKLYGQYSVHALCDALEVSRGTFYNHIFRKKANPQHKVHREQIREQVRAVFDEFEQRYGSRKIHAVLAEIIRKTSRFTAIRASNTLPKPAEAYCA